MRASICNYPTKWRWSIYHATTGAKSREDFLTVNWILQQFGKKRPNARKRYTEFVLEGCTNSPTPWEQLKSHVVFGSDVFVQGLQGYLKGHRQTVEIPKVQRYADRPQLTTLLPESIRRDKLPRNASILKAHMQCGYTLKQIADHLDLHYSTISRIVSSFNKLH